MNSADPVKLAAIHAACFPRPWDIESFENLLVGPSAIVCAEEDGFILCRLTVDEAELLTFAVRPERQGQGTGRRLLKAALAVLAEREAKEIFLEVAVDNAPAIFLYESEGFVRVGTRPGYYGASGTPVDALLMQKSLRV